MRLNPRLSLLCSGMLAALALPAGAQDAPSPPSPPAAQEAAEPAAAPAPQAPPSTQQPQPKDSKPQESKPQPSTPQAPAKPTESPPAPAQPAPTPAAQGEGATEAGEEEVPEVATSDDPNAAESAATRVPLAEIQRYVAVYNAVKDAYVEPVDDRALMQSAIKGLLLDLDPHSEYLVRKDAEAFDESSSGVYDGIGVEVLQQPDGSVRVIAPIDDTPAQRAGIKSGDVIIAVDGKPLEPGQEDSESLRGKPGSKLVLTIVREGQAKPFYVTVERETIRVASVRSRMLEPGYGYIRVSQFQADTAAAFEKQLAQLQQPSGGGTSGKGLCGLVIDLRSNPGGLLTSAVQIADDLLDKGKIVTTKGRVPISDAEFGATPGDRLAGAPVVVLVDAGSASASEVLAGALRDNGRARVVGSRTFGKGSVQTVLPLDNGDSVKLTTARYYTPSGKSIQALGIVPDVVFAPDKPATLLPGQQRYSEAALSGHLQSDAEREGTQAGDNAGDVLDGDDYVARALAELKKTGASAAAAPAGRN